MRLRIFNGLMAILAASWAATPVCAELYKWVDERGVVTYSDRRPVDAKIAETAQPVPNRLSVYAPDAGLRQAIETTRAIRSQQELRGEPERGSAAHTAATVLQAPTWSDPCLRMDCSAVSGVFLPIHRRPHLHQAVLPAGAIAGTINAPGMIPGNTAGGGSVPVHYGPAHHHLNQAVLPAGAIAGTVNSPGIIPGNTGTSGGVLPGPVPAVRRGPMVTPAVFSDPLAPRR